ncbi:oligosaccharide flippase family protein [Pontibacillus salipaludis]|nr:oligosaccharide flippase family protein [Pontibacillus salipaludis]
MLLKHLKNISFLFSSKLASTFFAFMAQVLSARMLAKEDYGLLSFYLILINILASIIGFGLGKFWLRRFAVEGKDANRWVIPSIWTILFLFIISLPIYFFIPYFSLGASSLIIGITLLPLMLFQSSSTLIIGKYQVDNNFKSLSFFEMMKNTAFLLSALTLFVLGFHIFLISYGLLALILLIFTIISIRSFYKRNLNIKLETSSRPKIKTVLSTAWPFGLQGVLYMLYYQVDIILITILLGAIPTGLYNASFSIISLIFIFPSMLFQVYLLPKSNTWIVKKDIAKVQFIRKKLSFIALLLGLLIAIVIYFLSEIIITLIYGVTFFDSVLILQVLLLSIPFRFASNSIGVLFVSEIMVSKKVYIQGGGALLNVCLNLLLIKQFGVLGAAVSTVLTEILVAILMYTYSAKITKEM